MGAAFLISSKDLRQRLRDRSAILFAIVAPLGLIAILSTIFGGAFGVDLDLRFAVVDEDGGELAAAFTTGVLPAVEEQGFATVETLDDRADAEAQVRAGDLTAAFVIPAGFSAAATSGGAVPIEVLGNVDADIGTSVAEAIANAFAAEVRAVQIAIGTVLGAAPDHDPAEVQRLAEAVTASAPPAVLGAVEAPRRELDPVTYLSAGMAVFFLFFTVQFGVTSLLEERRDGTLQRLLAAPVSRASIYGGKALTSFLLGIVSMTVLVVASDLLIGAEWGDPVGVALLVVAGVTAATALMAFLATVARTAEQANVWQSVTAVVMGMLGGTFFPVAQAGGALEFISLLTPHRWFLRGLSQLAGGGTVPDALPAMGALLVFALVGFAATGVRLRGEVLG